jgi:uncharacterized protein involved in exopolysaccharide biosynthesis
VTERTDSSDACGASNAKSRDVRTLYILPEEVLNTSDTDVNLRRLWDSLWQGRWWIIAVTAIFFALSWVYAFTATEWFRAEVLLAPANQQSAPSFGGELGGLAALAGVSLGGSESAESIATLSSQDFARDFVTDFKLIPVFFADDWDAAAGRWRDEEPESQPDVRDAVEYLQDKVLDVSEDPRTGLVTMRVDWTDADIAAKWADVLVDRLNAKLRQRALQEAQVNIAYLRAELDKTNVVALQESIGRLLENEMQKLMLARGNEEFAFRVIDTSGPPKKRVWPKRMLILVLGTALGGTLSIILVLLGRTLRQQRVAGSIEP